MKYLLLTLSIIITTFTGCEKGKLVEEYFLKDGTKEVVPYIGNDVLTFRYDNIDSMVFVGGERMNEMRDSYVSVSSDDYNLWEYNYISFSNVKNVISFNLKSGVTRDYLSISYETDEEKMFIGTFFIVNGSISSSYYDSIQINQTVYHTVYFDTMNYIQHTANHGLLNYPTKLYYSTQFGILKIDFSDSTTWELESVSFGGE